MSTVLEPIWAKDKNAAAKAFGQALNVTHRHAKLIAQDGREIPIPKAISKILEQVIPLLVTDHAVSIVPVGALLTTQEAADLLNVSRPHLVKLLKKNHIRYELSDEPGSHRKIRFIDLMEYKHKLDMDRRKQLQKLTELSQEAGLYED